MQAISRAAFFLVIWLAAISAHGAVGALAADANLVFKAGRYTKAARLSALSVKDLRHANKMDNITGLLELAEKEKRLDTIQMMELSRQFQGAKDGDVLLFTCLRNRACHPDKFLEIANTSPLHAQVVRRHPSLSVAQVNDQVGALTERLMNYNFEASGWTRVEGQIGRQGLDGLYIKREGGVIKDVLIAESKYNTSSLGQTAAGVQMSETWVLRKMEELVARFPDEQVYKDIKPFIEKGDYRARLWTLRADEDALYVTLKKVQGNGGIVLIDDSIPINLPDLSEPFSYRVNIKNPASSFEKSFVQWFNAELDSIGQLPN